MPPLRSAAFAALSVLFLPGIAPAAGPFDTFQVTLEGVLPFTDQDPWMADVWGYELDARAFALACQGNALRVVDVTNPAQPFTASLVPAIGVDLKDAKTFGHHAYCVNQNGKLQVVDLRSRCGGHGRGDRRLHRLAQLLHRARSGASVHLRPPEHRGVPGL
jgi:hypothetical protein